MSKADRTIERMRGRPPLPGYRPEQRLPQGAVRAPQPYNGSKLPEAAGRIPSSRGLVGNGKVNPDAFKGRGANLPNALYGSGSPKMVKPGKVRRVK